MEWITVISLILIGIFLVIAEILFLPGVFVFGAIGVLCSCYGVYLSFDYFGDTIGTTVLIFTLIANVISFILAFRGNTWEKISLKQTHNAKVNDDFKITLNVGDRGKTLSTLKPVGKVLFHENVVEVQSKGNYIGENVEIEIERISSSKVFVKTI